MKVRLNYLKPKNYINERKIENIETMFEASPLILKSFIRKNTKVTFLLTSVNQKLIFVNALNIINISTDSIYNTII